MTAESPRPNVRLSICMGTYNRAKYIGAALDSVIEQLPSDCEIVISDNASIDETESIVREYAGVCGQVKYFRNDTNLGVDRNFDNAVAQAKGEYCWLMSDDDMLKAGAISRVLSALRLAKSVIIVNVEYKDQSMSRVIQRTALRYRADRTYAPNEMERMFMEMAEEDFFTYIGNLVVRRDLWMTRKRSPYFGSLFIHMGIVYQDSLPNGALFVSEPLVSVRVGNSHSHSGSSGEVLFDKLPRLLMSLPVSQSARRRARGSEPFAFSWLLMLRGIRFYSLVEYERWVQPREQSAGRRAIYSLIARAPVVLVNWLLSMNCFFQPHRGLLRYGLENARKPLPPDHWLSPPPSSPMQSARRSPATRADSTS